MFGRLEMRVLPNRTEVKAVGNGLRQDSIRRSCTDHLTPDAFGIVLQCWRQAVTVEAVLSFLPSPLLSIWCWSDCEFCRHREIWFL